MWREYMRKPKDFWWLDKKGLNAVWDKIHALIFLYAIAYFIFAFAFMIIYYVFLPIRIVHEYVENWCL